MKPDEQYTPPGDIMWTYMFNGITYQCDISYADITAALQQLLDCNKEPEIDYLKITREIAG